MLSRIYGWSAKYILPATLLLGLVLSVWQVFLPWYFWLLALPLLLTLAYLGYCSRVLRQEEARLAACSLSAEASGPQKSVTDTRKETRVREGQP